MIRDREKIRLGVNVLLTAGIVYLEIKNCMPIILIRFFPMCFFSLLLLYCNMGENFR